MIGSATEDMEKSIRVPHQQHIERIQRQKQAAKERYEQKLLDIAQRESSAVAGSDFGRFDTRAVIQQLASVGERFHALRQAALEDLQKDLTDIEALQDELKPPPRSDTPASSSSGPGSRASVRSNRASAVADVPATLNVSSHQHPSGRPVVAPPSATMGSVAENAEEWVKVLRAQHVERFERNKQLVKEEYEDKMITIAQREVSYMTYTSSDPPEDFQALRQAALEDFKNQMATLEALQDGQLAEAIAARSTSPSQEARPEGVPADLWEESFRAEAQIIMGQIEATKRRASVSADSPVGRPRGTSGSGSLRGVPISAGPVTEEPESGSLRERDEEHRNSTVAQERARMDQRQRELAVAPEVPRASPEEARRLKREREAQLRRDEEARRKAEVDELASRKEAERLVREDEERARKERERQRRGEEDAKRKEVEERAMREHQRSRREPLDKTSLPGVGSGNSRGAIFDEWREPSSGMKGSTASTNNGPLKRWRPSKEPSPPSASSLLPRTPELDGGQRPPPVTESPTGATFPAVNRSSSSGGSMLANLALPGRSETGQPITGRLYAQRLPPSMPSSIPRTISHSATVDILTPARRKAELERQLLEGEAEIERQQREAEERQEARSKAAAAKRMQL